MEYIKALNAQLAACAWESDGARGRVEVGTVMQVSPRARLHGLGLCVGELSAAGWAALLSVEVAR